ncbi:hypothetical protein [Acinetobacter sp. ANC 5414]|uniref:hypothetical protein n=1 Tax=Acinetobacter sp. ANC 5414 TaxID=2731251 RepID=UPI00148FE8F9|nr:hypothetical protein [Acinetobacter sp. ANC 5414]NNG99505.1 hypothetical protein [Acinetobacter sp. ANC 5414]
MNLIKISALMLILGCTWSMMAHADDIVILPTLKVLAEPELRKETGIVPYQNEEKNLRALQHQVIRNSREAQNFMIDSHMIANLDIQPLEPQPDLNSLSPLLQQYVLSIAQGLQSSDPTQGLYIMLQPFGIDRSNSMRHIERGNVQIDSSNSMQHIDRGMHIQIDLNNVSIGTLEQSINNFSVPDVMTPKK